jgi:hypothetical protein
MTAAGIHRAKGGLMSLKKEDLDDEGIKRIINDLGGDVILNVVPDKPLRFELECSILLAERKINGQTRMLGVYDVTCNGAKLMDERELGTSPHVGFEGPAGEYTEIARQVITGALEYLTSHLPEELIATTLQVLSEARQRIQRDLDFLPPDSDELKKQVEEVRRRSRTRSKSRLALRGRGGKEATWGPDKKLKFLQLYERTLERMRRGDKRLPENVLRDLELRGTLRHEAARKYAAHLLKVPYSTYLRQVLKDARKLRKEMGTGHIKTC